MTIYDKRTRVYLDGREEIELVEVPHGLVCTRCWEHIATSEVCLRAGDGKHEWVEQEGVDFTMEEIDAS